jgi:MFS family permease
LTAAGQTIQRPETVPPKPVWLNRNVVGMGITSLLSDTGHEMITVLLPGFLTVLGLSSAALGTVEGVADSVSSFVKLGSGWVSDRLGRRKGLAAGGYLLTGLSNGLFALANSWLLVLAARTVGWFGRGFRTPLRNAMLASSVPAEVRGKAFGFERAGDTIGAIIGPLLGVGLLGVLRPHTASASTPFRIIFLIGLIPGLGAAIAFALTVREQGGAPSRTDFWATVRALPQSFWRALLGIGVFGMGDFARTLMILAATQLLLPQYGLQRAAQIAGLLYVGHNAFHAAYSYPVGVFSDRFGRRGLLALGYLAGALASFGFLAAFLWHLLPVVYLLSLFGLAGFSMAVVDALESAWTGDLVADETLRGTAYGVLGTVSGIGDLLASVVVGSLWTGLSPVAAFGYAALLMSAGAVVIYRQR